MDTFVVYDNKPNGLFTEGLNIIIQEDLELTAMISNELAIAEGSFVDFIKKIDIKKIFTTIFEKLKAVVTKILGAIKAFFNKHKSTTALINEYKDQLKSCTFGINCSGSTTIFNHLEDKELTVRFKSIIDTEINNLLASIDQINSFKSVDEIQSGIHLLYNEMRDTRVNFEDNTRKVYLNKDYPVTADQFNDELRKYYTPGTEPNKFFSDKEIRDLVKIHESSKSVDKIIKADKHNIEFVTNTAKIKIKSINLANLFNRYSLSNADIAAEYSKYIDMYSSEVQSACNIFLQALNYKYNALIKYRNETTRVLDYIIREALKEGMLK